MTYILIINLSYVSYFLLLIPLKDFSYVSVFALRFLFYLRAFSLTLFIQNGQVVRQWSSCGKFFCGEPPWWFGFCQGLRVGTSSYKSISIFSRLCFVGLVCQPAELGMVILSLFGLFSSSYIVLVLLLALLMVDIDYYIYMHNVTVNWKILMQFHSWILLASY